MTDVFSKTKRSQVMSRIRGRNTRPERQVRSLLHRAGYRFRLHRRDLPGSPDIVLRRYTTVVFVHGCFWHRHKGCQFATTPKSRAEFWARKFESNTSRDSRVRRALQKQGWQVLVVWECELKAEDVLLNRVIAVLKRRMNRLQARSRARAHRDTPGRGR